MVAELGGWGITRNEVDYAHLMRSLDKEGGSKERERYLYRCDESSHRRALPAASYHQQVVSWLEKLREG